MTVLVISESTTEPITLDEAAMNLGLMPDTTPPPVYAQGLRITKLIKAARQACENELEVSLVTKTLEVAHSSFWPAFWPGVEYRSHFVHNGIALLNGPVRSIVSVTYIDPDGNDIVLASDQYRINPYVNTPVLIPAYGVCWPSHRHDINSLRVRYVAGYDATISPPMEVPEPIRQAMHLYIGHYFRNREAVDDNTLAELPLGATHLLTLYRKGLGV